MRTLILIFAGLLLFSESFAQTLSLGHAMNVSTRQRMFSQRAAKAYALCVQGIDVDLNTEQVMGSIASFEANQAKLVEFAPTLDIKTKVNRVSTLWENYSALLKLEPNKQNLMDVVESNEDLFQACDAVVRALNEYAATQPEFDASLKMGKGRNIIDGAARVRSLAQRMTFYYAIRATGLPFAQSAEMLETSHTDFRTYLGNILLFSENSPEAEANIKEIVAIWESYSSLESMLKGDFDLSKMNDDFNKVVALIDKVLLEYEELIEGPSAAHK